MNDRFAQNFDEQCNSIIETYVNEQDLHVLETPLKSEQSFKIELKERMREDFCYAALSRSIFNALTLITRYLMENFDSDKAAQIHEEIGQSFEQFQKSQEIYLKGSENEKAILDNKEAQNKPWVLFGLGDDTLFIIYDVVMKCFNEKDLEGAKDILSLLLIFAPNISSFYNAIGFAYQQEKQFDKAINHYLIAQEIDPDNLETKFYLARCYLEKGQNIESLQTVENLRNIVNASEALKVRWASHVEKLNNDILNKKI